MKRKILALIIVSISLYSCFEKKEEAKVETSNSAQTPTNQIINETTTLYGLTNAEAQDLISKKIDPQKVSAAIKAAENGDEQSILGLAKLYLDMSNKEKAKKYLQIGADRNIQSAIYNLAILYKQEGNTVEAEKLMAKLPKGAMFENARNTLTPGMTEGANLYNQGLVQIKSKNYNVAKSSFQKAYSLGIKESDVQLGLIAKQQKNTTEAIKWFKVAAARGVIPANYEVGAMLFDSGKRIEAIPYLTKSFNAGNKGLATPIAIGYQTQGKLDEAIKWFKIAEKNGDKSATQAIKDIEDYKTGKIEEKAPSNENKPNTVDVNQETSSEQINQSPKMPENIDKIIEDVNKN